MFFPVLFPLSKDDRVSADVWSFISQVPKGEGASTPCLGCTSLSWGPDLMGNDSPVSHL